jgi:hypothetical protein
MGGAGENDGERSRGKEGKSGWATLSPSRLEIGGGARAHFDPPAWISKSVRTLKNPLEVLDDSLESVEAEVT